MAKKIRAQPQGAKKNSCTSQRRKKCLKTNNVKTSANYILTHYLPPLIQAKIDDFHIFINISAGIYSSVLSYIPFERGIN